jgi:uroporphyrinogen-III synthase
MPQKKATSANTSKKMETPTKVLITQPRPDGIKSPYFDLALKYGLTLDFQPFISVEPVASKDFRKQKIELQTYSAVIFTSKNAIDHFFRICDEMKITISQDTKYFCITEAVALYLQKFILYRKRKVFFGSQGNNKGLLDIMNRHKSNERFLYPCSESFDSDITNWLKKNECEYAIPVVYKVISKDIKSVIEKKYDIICFFTPGGVKSLLENFPNYKQNKTLIATFGENTSKIAEEVGLDLFIKAPKPNQPSMVSALENYFLSRKSKKTTK